MLDGNFRKSVETVTLPTGRWLVRIGFSADVLTFSGLVFSFATAWMIALGHSGSPLCAHAHRIPRPLRRSSRQGVEAREPTWRVLRLGHGPSDRLLDPGWRRVLPHRARSRQLVLLPFAILTTTYLISYQRSKAESLGLAAKGV